MAQADIDNEELLTIRDHINYLRKWIHQQQPALHSLDSDEFLLRFLRIADFRLENAKERLISFWQYRTENPRWFKNRDLVNNMRMCQIAQLAYCLQLPKLTKEKRLIFLMRLGHNDSITTMFTIDDIAQYIFAIVDIINSQPNAQLYGLVVLLDFTNLHLRHLIHFTYDRMRRFVDCWEKMYPAYLCQIHFYNYPTLFNPILHIFRHVFCQELNDRIYLHSRTSDDSMKKSLHRYIDPSLLPNEYGGQLGPVTSDVNKTFVEWIRHHNDHIIELEQYGVDLQQVSQLLKTVRAPS